MSAVRRQVHPGSPHRRTTHRAVGTTAPFHTEKRPYTKVLTNTLQISVVPLYICKHLCPIPVPNLMPYLFTFRIFAIFLFLNQQYSCVLLKAPGTLMDG